MKPAIPTALCLLLSAAWCPGEPPNTQPETIPLTTPEAALAGIRAPEGFEVTLFAAEPDIRQPIDLAFDTRGRLWVAECYTYAEDGAFDMELRDRIVIFEDTNDDGRADKRTVFWDQGQRLTSIEIGFGGVWALCTPHLLFIPDHDGDDRPDGEPVVVLDGWVPAGHTLANGLRWGPDGWLYGRHGIQGTSQVGAPGAPAEERVPINCGIWRHHPQRNVFEVVSHGTTNPWGMDWNDHGQLFFINTVIGHLWHAIPGAHFRRMYGEHLRSNLYESIEQAADHVHWDEGKEDWTAQARSLSDGSDVSDGTSLAGGGHAHVGMMFYLGDSWPEDYRDELFTLNMHGRRINRDHVERAGATYIGQHRPDVVFWDDPWFRGIELAYGPDGGVYVLDWSDIGECHEADGLHRTSGRIYKVTWSGGPKSADPSPGSDIAGLTDSQLVALQRHPNEWFVRQSRRVLQERAVRGADLDATRQELWEVFDQQAEVPRKLRALWALHVTGGVGQDRLVALLQHENEHIRVWAIQLLVDSGDVAPEVVSALEARAKVEDSGLVLTYLASAMQRLPAASRFGMAGEIAAHHEFAQDRVLPLMVWYGIEAGVLDHQAEALQLARHSQMPQVVRYVARRITGEIESQPAGVAGLVELLRTAGDAESVRHEVLAGMAEALRGWGDAPAPDGWPELAGELLQEVSGEALLSLVRELSIVFGEGLTHDGIIDFVLDRQQAVESRRQAIRALTASRAPGLGEVLKTLLDDPATVGEAVRGMAVLDPVEFAPLLVGRYGQMDGSGKDAAVEVLASRADSAALLLDAVDEGIVPSSEIDPFLLRQMQLAGDERLIRRIAVTWPQQRLIAPDKLQKIVQYRELAEGDGGAPADLASGRAHYDRLCAQCHKLFDDGGTIGPELTGAQRNELVYWLENIIDPSAVIPEGYQMSMVTLDDGRLLSGRIGEQTDRTVILETPTEQVILQRSAVEAIEESPLSLMPEGLLDTLTDQEARDLLAYLMSPHQVEAAGAPDTDPPPKTP
ncbi:c-type cytochrome [soil metagenome]